MSYASALVELEKTSQKLQLAMGAANKNHLLHRIENIVGMKKKQPLNTLQLSGILGGLLMLIVVNALIFTGKHTSAPAQMMDFSQPSAFFVDHTPVPSTESHTAQTLASLQPVKKGITNKILTSYTAEQISVSGTMQTEYTLPPQELAFTHVSYDETGSQLDAEQKTQVKTTVENTKKVLEIQWSQIEKTIGDGMTAREKRLAKQDYLREISAINWEKIEKNLAADYEELDWNKINGTVSNVFQAAKLDSLETSYKMALEELNRKTSNCAVVALPMPDVSIQQIQKVKTELKGQITELRNTKSKKIIKL
jgi:hypothetical protein